MKAKLEPLTNNSFSSFKAQIDSENPPSSPSEKKVPGSDVPSLPCFAPKLRPLSGMTKTGFETTVERSRGVRDRIKDKLHSTFTDEVVADQDAFAKSVLNYSTQSSAFQPQLYDLKINKEGNITEQDGYVSKKKQIGVYPVSDTPFFPPYRPHTSWQVGLRKYEEVKVKRAAENSNDPRRNVITPREDDFGFELVDEELSDTDEPKARRERQKSLMELKAEKYVQKELEMPDEEVVDRYFGANATMKFGDTYRQLHRHADLLRGGREELEFVIRDEEEARIFQRTEMELVQLGVITPRDMIAEAKSKPSRSNKLSTAIDFSTNDEDLTPLEEKEMADGLELDMTYQPSSPRAVFLTGCLRHGMAPRAISMIRKRISPIIDLSHMGIGNATAILLAEALDKMPYLQTLNLADNNLDDTGLAAIITSASRHPTLEVLDISQNVMDDDASSALADFLGRPDCTLRCLRMSASDIDDGECAHFVEILMQNRTLQELDMSKNLIGKDENLNVVKPDFVTGGESLAELLKLSLCPLQTLNLHWNMIRLEGAEVLCDALRTNNHLTHLDLSFNSLGSHATSVLGAALLENKHLRHLNIANNSVDSVGTTTLVVGLREHPQLHEVILDGNPIGEQGARAVMKVIAQLGYRLMIRTMNCDITTKNLNIKLRHDIPVGDYLLDLTNVYDRAIAFELFEIVANDTNIDCSICDWYQQVTKPPTAEDLANATKPAPKKPAAAVNASSRPGSPSGREGNNATTKDGLSLLVQAWGPPTGSYYVVRFDERRAEDSLSNEELQEEAFNQAMAPVADLSAPTIFRTVKEYDTVGTDSFPTDRLLDLYDELLLHKKMHPQSRYKKVKTALSMHFPKNTDDMSLDGSEDSSKSSAHLEFDSREALKLDAMLDRLVEDSKKALDPHESGVIDINSFVEYITERARGAQERLHQLRHIPRVSARQRSSSGGVGVRPTTPMAGRPPDIQTKLERFIPPAEGWMRIRVVESYNITAGSTTLGPPTPSNNGTKPPSSPTQTRHQPFFGSDQSAVENGDHPSQLSAVSSIGSQTNEHDLAPSGFSLTKAKALRLIEQLKHMSKSHPVLLLLYAIDSVWLRLEEAQLLYSFARLKADSDDPTAALAKILLRMQSGSEAMRMLYCCVGDNVLLLRRLKSRLGNAYYPLINIFSGYYCLDLSNTLDRFCLKRLIEKSVRNTDARRQKGYWDTSQHGHWSCFRNEYHRHVPLPPGVVIPGIDANGMPIPNMVAAPSGKNKDAAAAAAGEGAVDANNSIISVDAAKGNTIVLTNGLGSIPAITINPRIFCPIPNKGRLEFDFVNIDRPDPSLCRAVHEDLIIDTLLLSRLLSDSEVDWAMNRLREMAQYNRRTFLPDARPPFRPDLGRALSMSEHMHTMYTTLHLRQTARKRSAKREAIKNLAAAEAANSPKKENKKRVDSAGKAKTNLYSSSASRKKQSIFGNANKPPPAAGGALPVGSNPIQDAVQAVLKSQNATALANGRNTIVPSAAGGAAGVPHNVIVAAKATEAMIRFKSLSRRGKKADQKQRIWGKRLYEVVVEGLGSDEHKSAQILEFFEAELGTMWLQCRYLALILEVFGSMGSAPKSNLGSYRVELIVLLFDRLVDICNFELVLATLNAEEHAAVFARIGTLNLFNPCKCEGGWSFDLQRWEERQVAKMLIHLSVVEPGENWNNKSFAYDRGFVPIPGWDLNKGWLSEEGLPKKGLLSFEMFAGDGLRLAGCCVDMKLRQILCALTNVPQRNFVAEVERQEMLTDEKQQEFHRALDRHAVNVIHFDTKPHAPTDKPVAPKPVFPLVKLITQLDILRQLSNGTGSVEEMQRHLLHIQHFHQHVEIAHVLHPEEKARRASLKLAQDELDDHYHDILHYTVEDANDHLRTESDCSWNYTSTARKPDIWV